MYDTTGADALDYQPAYTSAEPVRAIARGRGVS